jgi:hypothetical protein
MSMYIGIRKLLNHVLEGAIKGNIVEGKDQVSLFLEYCISCCFF